jgi:hypothetical protein
MRFDWLQGLVPALQVVGNDGEYQGALCLQHTLLTTTLVSERNCRMLDQTDAVRVQVALPRAAGHERRPSLEASGLLSGAGGTVASRSSGCNYSGIVRATILSTLWHALHMLHPLCSQPSNLPLLCSLPSAMPSALRKACSGRRRLQRKACVPDPTFCLGSLLSAADAFRCGSSVKCQMSNVRLV